MSSPLYKIARPAGVERPVPPRPAVGRKTLEQRVEEIRGLVKVPGLEQRLPDLWRPEALRDLSLTLVDALEASQRKLIESNIQLISLREVAHNLLSVQTPDRAAETIALYIHKAFDYERVSVLLLDRERRRLSGRTVAAGAADSAGVARSGNAADSAGVARSGNAADSAGAARSGNATDSAGAPRPGSAADSAVPAHIELDLAEARGVLAETFLTVESRLIAAGHAALTQPDELNAVGFDLTALNSCLIVPLRSGKDRMLGVILVGRCHPNPALTPEDMVLLDSVGGTMATIVENARLYAELRQEELFRNDILNSMGSGLVAIDLDGRTISLNQTAVRMTGFTPDEVIGHVPPFFGTGDKGVEAALRGSFEGTPVLRREARLTRKDGSAFPASFTTSPLRSADGQVYGAIATFLDLTEFKRMEERLAQLDRLAVLGRFTAGIAHEIRNPLTGISTGVQYLTRGMETADPQYENARFILAEIQRLNRIVEDLFRVTHPQPLMTTLDDLGRLVDRSLQSLGSLAADNGIGVERSYDTELPAIPMDADQMQQVVINLLKNAIEATPPGGRLKLVTGRRPGRRGEAGWAVLKVIDTGSGMSPEVQKKILEPFFTAKKNGTGLGLYITHGIVERHGGHLRVESQEGAGSTFTIELPLAPLADGGKS